MYGSDTCYANFGKGRIFMSSKASQSHTVIHIKKKKGKGKKEERERNKKVSHSCDGQWHTFFDGYSYSTAK